MRSHKTFPVVFFAATMAVATFALATKNRDRSETSGTSRAGTPATTTLAGSRGATIDADNDCNGNNIADSIEISNGDSTDCDGNGVLDECQWVTLDQLPMTGEPGNAFGASIARDGDVAIVGAPLEDRVRVDVGSATIFRHDGSNWIAEQTLFSSDRNRVDFFGRTVAIEGDIAIVGTQQGNDLFRNDGVVYVFRRIESGWFQEARLIASDASVEAQFGSAVALRGDLLAVGAAFKEDLVTDSGAAYVFRYNGTDWIEEDVLLAPGAGLRAKVGQAVAIGPDTILVGAPFDDEPESRLDAGAVYVYKFDGTMWNQAARLTASDADAGDHFGTAISVHDNVAIIGANGDDQGDSDSGAAYVFRYDGTDWIEEQKLTPADSSLGKLFGTSVSVGPDIAAIGAEGNVNSRTFFGAAYVFRYVGSKWTQEDKIVVIGPGPNGLFGRSVAVDDNGLLIGAEGKETVYALASPLSDCNENGSPDFCDILTGDSADCNDNRIPDDCEPDCNGDGVPDDCEQGDCNENGVLDTCDIASGVSGDCDGNLIPDECEPDCNNNGMVDPCEIISGVSSDCDENGVPDECQWLNQRPDFEPLAEIDGEDVNAFGQAVSIDGEVVLIGMNEAAVVFRLRENLWVEEQTLRDRSLGSLNFFGFSVSVDGNLAAIGAQGDDGVDLNAGATFLYRFNGIEWIEELKLAPVNLDRQARFGRFVSASGDAVLISAIKTNDAGDQRGVAYVFRFNDPNWVQEAMLAGPEVFSRFGAAVSLQDDVALVGASISRTAFLFRNTRSEWLEEAQLIQPESDTEESFGWSVAIDGPLAVIGASGAAFVYRQTDMGWAFEAKLISSSPDASTRFARTVAVSGNAVVVGDAGDFNSQDNTGMALVYRFNGISWAEESNLPLPARSNFKKFGTAVAMHDKTIIVSAPSNLSIAGSVFVFKPFSADCNENGAIDYCEIASGDGSDCNRNKVLDDCESDCNINGIADTCEISDGELPDCNANLIPDMCDLAAGFSDDCNNNDVPDECDPDCNGNGVVDECEILLGEVVDCDNNLVPDSCQSIQRSELTTAGLGQDSFFGGPVSVSGNVALVGMSARDSNQLESKSAFIYRFDGRQWLEEQVLRPQILNTRDGFGMSVSVDGNVALIGAPGEDAVYAFRHDGSTWIEEARMVPPNSSFPGLFGWNVAVQGNRAVIGDPFGNSFGKAYVFGFDGTNWLFETELATTRANHNALYGISVAIDGDAIIVGASKASPRISTTGSAFAFRYNGSDWIEEGELVASDARSLDRFGRSVAIQGDVAWIGAPDVRDSRGAAYVYRFDGSRWVEQAKIAPTDLIERDLFGVAVSILGDVVIVGATPGNGSSTGAAYLYRFSESGWIQQSKLVRTPPTLHDAFGFDVAINDTFAFIGAPYKDGDSSNEGAMYVFDLPGGDCNGNGSSDLCDISEGDSLDCDGDSIPDECEVGPDADGDGVFDDCDTCPASNITPVLVVNGCHTGASNLTLNTGCTMADELATCESEATNRGKLVSCVTRLVNDWKREGLLTGKGTGRIISCAATGHDSAPPTQRGPGQSHGRR